MVATVQLRAQTATDTILKAKMDSAWGYLNGPKESQQPQKAFDLFIQCANEGNPIAMNAIGVQYKNGLGVAANRQMAIQWFKKAANVGYTKAWYNLGTAYRETMNFTAAYNSYCKAANLGDPQSVYAEGYMLYKGFGCKQDYKQAAFLFAQGAYIGKPNSMYFYGLCLRNGYGVPVNTDSARYWLIQSSSLGYTFATDELNIKLPENVMLAGVLTDKLKAAQSSMPKTNNVINQYQKVQQQVAVSDVAGTYQGYLLKYDWSGQYVIEANKLYVTLDVDNDTIKGSWLEDDNIAVPIRAFATNDGIVFDKVSYSKTNHYFPVTPESLEFEKALLKIIKTDTGVYLAGNIKQHRVKVNEPAKPLYLALTRTNSSKENSILHLLNDDGTLISSSPIRAYPNPFGNSLTIDFNLKESSSVTTQLLTLDGKVVYSCPTTTLTGGDYTLPINVGQVPSGYYIVKLRCGNTVRTAKVVKL